MLHPRVFCLGLRHLVLSAMATGSSAKLLNFRILSFKVAVRRWLSVKNNVIVIMVIMITSILFSRLSPPGSLRLTVHLSHLLGLHDGVW